MISKISVHVDTLSSHQRENLKSIHRGIGCISYKGMTVGR